MDWLIARHKSQTRRLGFVLLAPLQVDMLFDKCMLFLWWYELYTVDLKGVWHPEPCVFSFVSEEQHKSKPFQKALKL